MTLTNTNTNAFVARHIAHNVGAAVLPLVGLAVHRHGRGAPRQTGTTRAEGTSPDVSLGPDAVRTRRAIEGAVVVRDVAVLERKDARSSFGHRGPALRLNTVRGLESINHAVPLAVVELVHAGEGAVAKHVGKVSVDGRGHLGRKRRAVGITGLCVNHRVLC